MIAAAALCWCAAFLWIQAPTEGIDLRVGSVEGVAISDPQRSGYGWRVLVGVGDTLLVARFETEPALEAGDRIGVAGRLVPGPVRFAGRLADGSIESAQLLLRLPPASRLHRASNALRGRVLGEVAPERSPGRALLAGFLVGHTDELSAIDADALRRAGLAHFVAVSGSNVALFLAGWWLAFAPLALMPRIRWMLGLVGLALFTLMTRGEPSVIRASATAGIVLVGRAAGVPLDPWSALSLAVIGSLVAVPEFAASVGFGLSVAATAGVLLGSRVFHFRPRAVSTLLGASLGAQVAVAPILVAVFGSMPLLSPLANLIAAPIVGLSTAAGGLGAVLGAGTVVSLGAAAAELVLAVAHVAAPWPQVGWGAMSAVVCAGALAAFRPSLRVVAAPVSAAVVLAATGFPGATVERPAVVFLNVGQGDAALVLGETANVLIDGGPDPVLLERALRHYGVDRVDLLIATHVHADHLNGLAALAGRQVGAVWAAFGPHSTPASDRLLTESYLFETPAVGTRVEWDGVSIEVLGPVRRYDGPNDQSLAVMVDTAGRRFLFPGDAEVRAQRDLGNLAHDVLKVPHQGAGTSDPDWITANAGSHAVISVGPNEFGHPADWVIRELERAGATVLRTDRGGDVIFESQAIRRRDARRRRCARRPRAGSRVPRRRLDRRASSSGVARRSPRQWPQPGSR